jgi:hypothetical protein
MAAHSPPPAPEWLTGIWRRESIVYSDGTEDRSTCVLWGQTRSRYVDLRIPADRPPARGRRSFDDFSEGELLLLAEQMGFAGHVVLKGDVCTWIRYIDYQPNTGRPDSGRLELNGDALHERGEASSVLGRDYHEIFHREHKAERCCAALQSFAPTQGGANEEGTARAVLILIDNHFLFAQARSEELPQGQSLRELVLAAGKDRSLIHRYLDCEISFGNIEGNDPWLVISSTIPFRERQRLLPRSSVVQRGETGSLVLCSDSSLQHWRIIDSSLPTDDLVTLFSR